MPKINYDKIPVYFCSKCKSLKVLRTDGSSISMHCGVCSSGHYIEKTNINTLIEDGTIKAVKTKGN